MTPEWIDRLFLWVQHPFFLFVVLVLLLAGCVWVLWQAHKERKTESEYCWELYGRSQKEILDLTGYLVEAIALARAPRRKDQVVQLAELEVRVNQFKDQKSREFDRDQAERDARRK